MEVPRKSQSSTPSLESAQKPKRGPGRPPKTKKDDDASAGEEDEEEDVDVCGLDEDRDDVFSPGFSLENFRKEKAKSSSNSKDVQKKQKGRDKSPNVTSKDTEDEMRSNGTKKRKVDEYSDDSNDSSESDDGSGSSDQGKTQYQYKDSSITHKKPHATLIKAAAFEYKSSGSLRILNKSESRIDDIYADRDCRQLDGDSHSCDEDSRSSGQQAKSKCTKRSRSTESKSKIAGMTEKDSFDFQLLL